MEWHNSKLMASSVFLVCLWSVIHSSLSQAVSDDRPFPLYHNVAKDRPVLTIPADSTCGIPYRNAFCVSSTSPSSVNCVQNFCEQSCGQDSRPDLPDYDNMLIASRDAGFSGCVNSDTVDVRPGSGVAQFSTSISSAGEDCFLVSELSPSAGINGSFTIVSWIWIDQNGPG